MLSMHAPVCLREYILSVQIERNRDTGEIPELGSVFACRLVEAVVEVEFSSWGQDRTEGSNPSIPNRFSNFSAIFLFMIFAVRSQST
jgi:hypothetical protein